jgi:serine/threonine-protein kinase
LRLNIVNLYKDGVGNPDLPEKLKRRKRWKQNANVTIRPVAVPGWSKSVVTTTFILSAIVVAVTLAIYFGYGRLTRPGIAATIVPEKSVAVLPFENLSSEKENAYFTDGVQDEILNDLSKVADLKVISRTSVTQYRSEAARNLREIAKALGVANVLEGSVQRVGGRVRVSAQLIDARTDMHIWADHYDRDLADVFAIQSEIAKTIADQLKAKISPSEKAAIEKAPTGDLAAFELYEKAKILWGDASDPVTARESLLKAAQLLKAAVDRDPNFVLAWCLLSKTQAAIYKQGHDHGPEHLDLANAAVQTALRLRPDAGEAHLARANYYYYGFSDFERARNELSIAKQTLPNNSEVYTYTGFIDRRQAKWAEATQNLERAVELDPLSTFILQQLALTYSWQHRYADEVKVWDLLLKIKPSDPLTRISRANVFLYWQADLKPHRTTLASLLSENPSIASDVDNPFAALCERNSTGGSRALSNYPREGVSTRGVIVPKAYWEGVFARAQGDALKSRTSFDAARSEVAKVVELQPDFAAAISLLGVIDAGLGRKEEALREGRRACELLPTEKDALDGTALAVNLAQIYAWSGENALAIKQIAAIQRAPNLLSYGLLKLHPYWDSLRGDPYFEKIVVSLAPKS